MKRILAIIVVLALSIAMLSACVQNTDTETPDTQSKGGDQSQTDTQVPEEKPITITLLHAGNKAEDGNDIELDILPKMVHEKFPNITIESTKLPDDQYWTTIKTKLAAGEAQDIFMCGPGDLHTWGKTENLKDLSELNIWDNIAPGAVNDTKYDGKQRFVPKGTDFLGVYYNKDLFEQAGITEEPKDWPSFLDACQKLKDAGITPITTGDKDAWYIQFPTYQIAANVVYPGNMDIDQKLQAGEASFADSKWIEALSRLKELYDKGYVIENSLGIGSAQNGPMFIDGKAAMTFGGTWDYAVLTAIGEAGEFERGYMPLPANDEGKDLYTSVATANGYCVNENTENFGAIKQVFEYWFDGESDLFKAYHKANPSIPIFKGVELDKELFVPFYNLYINGNSIYFCNQQWATGVNDEMGAKFQEVIGGRNTTVEDVAKAMDEKFRANWK